MSGPRHRPALYSEWEFIDGRHVEVIADGSFDGTVALWIHNRKPRGKHTVYMTLDGFWKRAHVLRKAGIT